MRLALVVLLVASSAFARGINLHVYTVDAKGVATQLTVLEIARGARCSGPLTHSPEVTSCQQFAGGELFVIHKARLRFVLGGKVKWERSLPGPVAYQGGDSLAVAIEVKGGLELRWLDADGNTTRTETLRTAKTEFKPAEWCGDRIEESYASVDGTLKGVVCLVLD